VSWRRAQLFGVSGVEERFVEKLKKNKGLHNDLKAVLGTLANVKGDPTPTLGIAEVLQVERLVPEARSAEEPNGRPETGQLCIPVARSAAGTFS
jgi:hypothetical protein